MKYTNSNLTNEQALRELGLEHPVIDDLLNTEYKLEKIESLLDDFINPIEEDCMQDVIQALNSVDISDSDFKHLYTLIDQMENRLNESRKIIDTFTGELYENL